MWQSEPDRLGNAQCFFGSVGHASDDPVSIPACVGSRQSVYMREGLAIIAFEPPEVVFLGGQAFVYVEQDWDLFPDVAVDALRETGARFFIYWAHLCTGTPIFEDGVRMRTGLLFHRCMELAGGMARLIPVLARTDHTLH